MRRRILPTFFVLAVLAPTAPLRSQGPARELSGFVRSAVTNQPVSGTIVTLESSAGEMIQQMTPEGNGRFNFANLDGAIYYVVARAPGHAQRRERADLVTYRRLTVQLMLHPDAATPTPGGTATPAVAVVNQRLLRIPEPARKEFEKGQHLLAVKKQPKESIPLFTRAIEKHADFPEAHLLMGTAHMDLGDWKNSAVCLKRAIELDPRLAAAHFALGTTRAQLGDLPGSEKSLLAGLQLEPQSAVGHWEMARLYWTLKRIPEAETHTRKTLEIAPQLAAARVMMGNVYLAKREPASAVKEFKEYLRLEPTGPFAAAAQNTIAKIEEQTRKP